MLGFISLGSKVILENVLNQRKSQMDGWIKLITIPIYKLTLWMNLDVGLTLGCTAAIVVTGLEGQ